MISAEKDNGRVSKRTSARIAVSRNRDLWASGTVQGKLASVRNNCVRCSVVQGENRYEDPALYFRHHHNLAWHGPIGAWSHIIACDHQVLAKKPSHHGLTKSAWSLFAFSNYLSEIASIDTSDKSVSDNNEIPESRVSFDPGDKVIFLHFSAFRASFYLILILEIVTDLIFYRRKGS